MSSLNKILRKIELKINLVIEKIYTKFYFLFFGIFFRDLGRFNRISLSVSFDNYGQFSIGSNNRICRNVVIWPSDFKLGSNNAIGPNTCIYGNVVIGDDVLIGPNCMFAGGSHGSELNEIPMRLQLSVSKGIQISDDVWIGANAVILDGVCISRGTVIGAGSVVTKSTVSNGIYAGNPAKLIKFRS